MKQNGQGRILSAFIAVFLGFAVLFIGLSVFSGCKLPTTRPLASVYIRFGAQNPASGAKGIVFDSCPELATLKISLEGTGPGGEVFPLTVVSGYSITANVVAGDWIFTGSALDSSGNVFLAGSVQVLVDPSKGAAASLKLSPLPGLGRAMLSYTVPTGVAAGAIWTGSLERGDGTVVAEWTDPLDTSDRVIADIPTGYYTLNMSLCSGETVLSGSTNIVRILKGFDTNCAITLSPAVADARLQLILDTLPGLEITAANRNRVSMRGFPLSVAVSGMPEASYSWNIAGKRIASGQSAMLASAHIPKNGVVDVSAYKDGQAGACSLSYSLAEPVLRGPWALYMTIALANEPAAASLTSPALSCSDSSGLLCATVSDASSSKIDIWRSGIELPDIAFIGSASIKINGSSRKAGLVAMAGNAAWIAASSADSNWLWLAKLNPDGGFSSIPPQSLLADTGDLAGFNGLRGVCFSPSGVYLYVIANTSRSIYTFELRSDVWVYSNKIELDSMPCGPLATIKSLALSSDGKILAASAAGSDAIILLDAHPDDGTLSWLGEAKKTAGFPLLDYPQALAFSPGTHTLTVACKDSDSLIVLDCSNPAMPMLTASLPKALGTTGLEIRGLAYAPSGDLLAVTGNAALGILSVPNPENLIRQALFDTAYDIRLQGITSAVFIEGFLLVTNQSNPGVLLFGKPSL